MNEQEWAEWVIAFRTQMLQPKETCEFVKAWHELLSRFPLDVALEALKRLISDPRISESGSPASFPQRQLPLILEHAKAITEARERKARKPITWGENPPTTEAWDAHICAKGLITKHAFAQRKRERETAK